MSNLATVQQVKNVRKHPNADALDLVQVLGWQVVTKRDEFKEGDLCVYIAIDTVLPERPEFEFLRNKSFRIKPIRLRGEESAGICFPISLISGYTPSSPMGWIEGNDVTLLLDIKHYEKPVPAELAGQAYGGLPGFIIMTDEDNLRSYPDAVPELWSRPFYITRKDDGCSGTFFVEGTDFGVCSRKIHLKESETNGFWRMARKYDIANALRTAFPDRDIALQGEVCGPGIQSNHLGLTELEIHVFNLFDIKNRHYLDYGKLVSFCNDYHIPMVTVIEEGVTFGYNLEELVMLASKQTYPNGTPAEGIVIRPKDPFVTSKLRGTKAWSGKVLNPLFEEEKKKKK